MKKLVLRVEYPLAPSSKMPRPRVTLSGVLPEDELELTLVKKVAVQFALTLIKRHTIMKSLDFEKEVHIKQYAIPVEFVDFMDEVLPLLEEGTGIEIDWQPVVK